MRAIIAGRFTAYTFAEIDQLDFDELMDLYGSALWLGEQEAKSIKRNPKEGS